MISRQTQSAFFLNFPVSYPDLHLPNFISAFYNVENRQMKVTLQSRKNKPLQKRTNFKINITKVIRENANL